MTLGELLKEQEKVLAGAGVPDSRTDAWLLLSYVFGISRAGYYMIKDDEADKEKAERLKELVERRAGRIPLQHIVGSTEFCGFKFRVTPDVLIPRQETEILVERASACIKKKKVLDLCTGSGCIAVSAYLLGNPLEMYASDISEKALEIAKENAAMNNADIKFIRSDIFKDIYESFDVILTNPPYIRKDEIAALQPEVQQDPCQALDGGNDGLDIIRRIIKTAGDHLYPHGQIFMEIGSDQGEQVMRIFEDSSFKNIEIIKDYAGLDRVVHAAVSRDSL